MICFRKNPGSRDFRDKNSSDILRKREINVWVTENGGNTGIQPGFVADALQTVED